MNILITGINGFVGSNLIRTFHLNHKINGLDIIPLFHDGVSNVYRWDEIDHLPPTDIIIHLAGIAHDLKRVSDEQDYFNVNVGLTKKIFDYFRQSKSSKFIFFSSVKAAADRIISGMLTEEATPSPVTAYGKSKLEAEKYILNFDLQESKKIFILRPCMILGPGNKGNLNLLFNLVSKGIPWPLGSFENQRSFCSIENICFIIEELINRTDIPSGIFNVADDDPISINELIRLIALSVNKKGKVLHFPAKFINTIAKIGDFLRLPLNTERLQKLTESYVVSNAKLKNAIGKKLPVSSREGLLKTFRSFNQKHDPYN